MEVQDHADASEGEAAGWLAKAGAQAVRDELMRLGVDPARLRPVGYGASRPRDVRATPAANARAGLKVVEMDDWWSVPKTTSTTPDTVVLENGYLRVTRSAAIGVAGTKPSTFRRSLAAAETWIKEGVPRPNGGPLRRNRLCPASWTGGSSSRR